eukprot:CAMPEP_0115085902 /NCGR_PEP_ID=MMETSP0227-20121206/22232_1 /TAXON_ID=89957 /ORGANISM="Polarella glacialis, Strain CCMP 1383" /LENGTH=248 /DNA_ID=CAMNT_0002475189 /DNA_START=13 /DNA_END=755 /DNA_ORIENTATION=+
MSAADKDLDGSINLAEFQFAANEGAFLDSNCDGLISPLELQAEDKKHQLPASLLLLLADADMNADGHLSKDEFVSAMTKAKMQAARGVCYQKEGSTCVMMQKKADDSTCFATPALCESGGATCYAKKGNNCVMLQEVADDKTCFPTAALCTSGGAVCFGNKGGHCVMLQQIADGVSCYSTQFDCKRFLPLTLGLQVGEAPLMGQDAATNATNATAAAAATDSGSSSGFPWWGWVLGGLGLAGAAGAAT